MLWVGMDANHPALLPADTTLFTAHWRHMDDDSLCEHPETCSAMGRDAYLRGGRPTN